MILYVHFRASLDRINIFEKITLRAKSKFSFILSYIENYFDNIFAYILVYYQYRSVYNYRVYIYICA